MSKPMRNEAMPYNLTPFLCPYCNGQVYLLPPDEDVPGRHWACLECGAWGVNFLGKLAWVTPGGPTERAICRTH
jgi:hypothetical protein